MSLVLADRVLETCTSPGTGAVSLLGAVTGYQAFSAAVGNSNTCYYAIADQNGANWEVGVGTYSSTGNTLARTTVLASSNGGATTNFASGSQNVFLTYPAEKALSTDNLLTAAISSGTANGVTYFNGSKVLTSGTALVFDGTNFGIGTSSPGSKLNVVGSTGFVGAGYYQVAGGAGNYGTNTTFYSGGGDISFAIGNSGSGYVYQTVTSNHALVLGTNNTERMRIDSYGNVGIGTTSPITYISGGGLAASQSSSGAETIPLALVNPNGTAGTQVSLAFTPNANIPLAKISAIRTTAAGLTSMTFGTYNGSSVAEAMRIDSSGNVGIGTTANSISNYTGLTVVANNGSAAQGILTLYGYNGTYRYSGIDFRGVTSSTYNKIAQITAQVTNGGPGTIAGALIFSTNQNTNSDTVTEAMRIDSSGNVGIGTSSPAVKLNVLSGTATTSATEIARFQAGTSSSNYRNYITLYTTNPSYWWEFSNQDSAGTGSSNGLAFNENSNGTNSTRVYFASGGNVGIGTSSPVSIAKLTVSNTATTDNNRMGVAGSTYLSTPSYTATFISQGDTATTGTTCGLSNANLGTLLFQNTSAGLIWANGNAPIVFGNSATERMRIDSSGNVGIGTTAPAGKLDVRTSAAGNIGYFYDSTSATDFLIKSVSGGTIIGTSTNTPLILDTNNTERARIDSSGNLLVGTTSAIAKLTIAADTSTAAGNRVASFSSTYSGGDSNYEALALIKYANSTATSNIFQRFYINQGVTGSGSICANGANTAAFGSFSDARLKENITALPSQLDNILALKPCEFDYKDGSGHQVGFIAQEMQEVYPDVVGEGEDGMLMITGWSKTEARLVKAIQEQQELILSLKAEIDLLKGAK